MTILSGILEDTAILPDTAIFQKPKVTSFAVQIKEMKIVKFILILIPAAMAILSGIMKISGSEQVVTAMTAINMKSMVATLGFAEIVFATLFMIPVTRTIGFLMLICYFSS